MLHLHVWIFFEKIQCNRQFPDLRVQFGARPLYSLTTGPDFGVNLCRRFAAGRFRAAGRFMRDDNGWRQFPEFPAARPSGDIGRALLW